METLQRKLLYDVLAPLVTAAFLGCAGCGVVVCLACVYFARFPRDRLVFKLLVAGLTVVCVGETATEAAFAFDWSVRGFGDYSNFVKLNWDFVSYCVFGTSVCTVQLWYAWRVWVMSSRGNRAVVGFIAGGALAGLGCMLRIGAFCAVHDTLDDFALVNHVVIAWLVLLVCVDLFITFSVIYYLVLKPRKESRGALKPDSRILSLAILAAKTGIVSLIMQVLIMALLLAMPRTYYWGLPAFLESKIYIGSLIASLNARDPDARVAGARRSSQGSAWSSRASDQAPRSAVQEVSAAEEGRALPLMLALAMPEKDGESRLKASLGRSDEQHAALSTASTGKETVVADAGSRVPTPQWDGGGEGGSSGRKEEWDRGG
ncbi:hypothetical protein JCM10213_008029 [Rhodosporidiobolus nylandii]